MLAAPLRGPAGAGNKATKKDTSAPVRNPAIAAKSAEKPSIIFGRMPCGKPPTPSMPLSGPFQPPPAVVLDTNAELDWLVFDDPGMRGWAAAVQQQRACWVACAAMRNELQRTLQYRSLARWTPDSEHVLRCFDQHAVLCPHPPAAAGPGLRCSDGDDQVFIELALAQRARWLLTHDRALHRLARRARLSGVLVMRPRDAPPPTDVAQPPPA